MNDNLVVTLAIVAYNQERFIAEAVRGALDQTYSPLEIVISDDCSPDQTFERIEQAVTGYAGPHTIRLNRNAHNVGFAGNINQLMALASGELVVIAAGDDVSLPHRVERLVGEYETSDRKAMSLYSNAIVIDENSRHERLHLAAPDPAHLSLEYITRRRGGVLGCTHGWNREVFDVFGPLDEKVVFEDLVIPFRSALLGEVRYVDEPLVLYRRHGHNLQFKEPTDVQANEVVSAMLKHADAHIEVYKSRLRDLETMSRLFPTRRDELLELQNVTWQILREKEDEKSLLFELRFFKRVNIINRSRRRGTPRRTVIRWVLLFFFPVLYLQYQRRLRANAQVNV